MNWKEQVEAAAGNFALRKYYTDIRGYEGFIEGAMWAKEQIQAAALPVAASLSDSYNQWVKETKRNGGILIGPSIKEFFEWHEKRTSLPVKEEPETEELLREAIAQINYLHGKFKETGTGNAVIARIENYLSNSANNRQSTG